MSKACQIMGYHRDAFYEIKRAFPMDGTAALVESRRGPRNPHPKCVSPEVETAILDYSLKFPTHGAERTANELRLSGVTVSGSGVRGVWLRHDLETRAQASLAAGREVPRHDLRSDGSADRAARAGKPRVPKPPRGIVPTRRIAEPGPFYWGTLKGVGKVYV